jgi:hypothetical protein
MNCLDGTTTTENASMMCGVERISIIEINQNWVSRLRETVDERFAEILDDLIARASHPGGDDAWGYDLVAWKEQTSPTEMVTDASGVARVEEAKPVKPYTLVITSDDESQEDIFYYGIQHPIHAMGLICSSASSSSASQVKAKLPSTIWNEWRKLRLWSVMSVSSARCFTAAAAAAGAATSPPPPSETNLSQL